MEDYEPFGKVHELGTRAANGNIDYVRAKVSKVNPDETDETGGVMTSFLVRLSDVFDEPPTTFQNWEQRLSIVVDTLQSHGFRMETEDLDYGFQNYFRACIQRIDFIDFLLRIGLRVPLEVLEYRDTVTARIRPDLEKIQQLRRLPSIPQADVSRSEQTFSLFTNLTGFDIHNEELNILRGKAVSGYIPKQQLTTLRRMEDFFRSNSPLTREAYVFRGIRISSLNELNMDPDTVTFVTWNLDKALNYFISPATDEDKKNEMPILLAIKLEPSTPIIRTRFPEELVLPTDSLFEPMGQPIFLNNIFCHYEDKGNIGAIIYVKCIPTKRKRMPYLYKGDEPIYQYEEEEDYDD